MLIFVVPTYTAFAQYTYTPSFTGGDYTSTYSYSPSYIGGDYTYSYDYTPSYVGGDYTYTYDYTPSYTGGDYTYAYDYGSNYVGGDYTYSYDYTDYSYTPYDYSYSYTNTYDYLPYTYTPTYSYDYSYDYVPYVYTPTYSYDYSYDWDREPRGESPYCRAFTADDYSVKDGDYVTLRWDTSRADDVDINNGVGDVAHDGSERVRVNRDTTFVLTVTNQYGTDTCRLTVEVEEERNNRDDRVSCDSFTVSDSRVDEGDYVTLRWRTSNADDVDINRGVGDVADDGEERVRVYNNSTFTLTARGDGYTDTCRVSVDVDDEKRSSKKKKSNDDLQCTLTISDSHIAAGQPVTLSWNNESADRAVLKDSHGEEIFDTREDSKIDEDKDAITLRPTTPTEYTLTVYDGNKREKCTVSTDTQKVIAATRVQGGINLGSVPYTGFEAGPMLTAIFYGLVVLWGVVIAYVLVIRKRSEKVAVEQISTVVSQNESASEISASVFETTVPANLPTMETISVTETMSTLETFAHTNYALLSSDALAYIAQLGNTEEEQIQKISDIIAKAKAQFPKEGDWIVINKERVLSVLG